MYTTVGIQHWTNHRHISLATTKKAPSKSLSMVVLDSLQVILLHYLFNLFCNPLYDTSNGKNNSSMK